MKKNLLLSLFISLIPFNIVLSVWIVSFGGFNLIETLHSPAYLSAGVVFVILGGLLAACVYFEQPNKG